MPGRRTPAKRSTAEDRAHLKGLLETQEYFKLAFKLFIFALLMLVLVKYHYFKWYPLPKIDEEFDVTGEDNL